MRKPPQNAALAFEALLPAFPHQRKVEELHRYSPLEAPVATFRQPHASHPALPNLREQRVRANGLARQSGSVRQPEAAVFQKTFLRQLAMFVKECHQLRRQLRILFAERAQPRGALTVSHSQRLIEIRT